MAKTEPLSFFMKLDGPSGPMCAGPCHLLLKGHTECEDCCSQKCNECLKGRKSLEPLFEGSI